MIERVMMTESQLEYLDGLSEVAASRLMCRLYGQLADSTFGLDWRTVDIVAPQRGQVMRVLTRKLLM